MASLGTWEIEGSVNKLIPLYLEKQGQLASEYQTTKPDYSSMDGDEFSSHFADSFSITITTIIIVITSRTSL